MILSRGPKLCNFIEWRGLKVVYKRYHNLLAFRPWLSVCVSLLALLSCMEYVKNPFFFVACLFLQYTVNGFLI
jgi:hypothetical protein